MSIFSWMKYLFSKKVSSMIQSTTDSPEMPEINFLTPLELKERMNRGDALVLLDVREPHELEICRLPGIVHIPMRQIPERITELNPQDAIVCICHAGGRSYQVAYYLRDHGFQNVFNLDGGMHLYSQQVDPAIPTY